MSHNLRSMLKLYWDNLLIVVCGIYTVDQLQPGCSGHDSLLEVVSSNPARSWTFFFSVLCGASLNGSFEEVQHHWFPRKNLIQLRCLGGSLSNGVSNIRPKQHENLCVPIAFISIVAQIRQVLPAYCIIGCFIGIKQTQEWVQLAGIKTLFQIQ